MTSFSNCGVRLAVTTILSSWGVAVVVWALAVAATKQASTANVCRWNVKGMIDPEKRASPHVGSNKNIPGCGEWQYIPRRKYSKPGNGPRGDQGWCRAGM